MKITSINFIATDQIPNSMRNTQASGAIKRILEQLAKAPAGQSIYIVGEFKKYERYGLQKRLQKHGQKVVVSNGQHNGQPVLMVKKLTDKEWQEWLVPAGTTPAKSKAAKS